MTQLIGLDWELGSFVYFPDSERLKLVSREERGTDWVKAGSQGVLGG